MKITVLTLFPDFFVSPLNTGIINGAIENKTVEIEIVHLREYGEGNYKRCDDYSYGGGPGMLLTCNIFKKYFDTHTPSYTVLFTPTGKQLNQEVIKELAEKDHITLILGHYEGVDKRVEELYTDLSLSIGDYVLSGGEIASLVLIDAISRYKGVLGNDESVKNDTFEENLNGLLEYDQYTRPPVFENIEVPSFLLNGSHKEINNFRHNSSLIKTFEYRADLFAKYRLTKKDIKTIFNYLLNKTK